MKRQSLHPAIRLVVACTLVALGMRTWLVMGLIEPVTVSGSSMVPAYRGPHVAARCSDCDHAFRIGAEFAAGLASMSCPNCLQSEVPLDGITLQRGDRLWVDRFSLQWREPRRWESIVARNPQDGGELCLKRVVGLPGERVELRGGEVLIDGEVLGKSPDQQQLMRRLIHRETRPHRRWQAAEDSGWKFDDDRWQRHANERADVRWLRYRHPSGESITDDVTYNAGITRKLNHVDEFLLSVDVRLHGTGTLFLRLEDGRSAGEIRFALPGGTLEVIATGQDRSTHQLPTAVVKALTARTASLQLANFDQQFLLVIDDHVILRRPWPAGVATGTASPFAIGAEGLDVALSNLSLYRDIYYSDYPVGAAPPAVIRWLLGPNEYFLLGDNPPVSIDSRLWGPVPARMIVGKPL